MREAGLKPGEEGILRYRDADGQVPTRRIEILARFRGRNGMTYIRAFCHLKNEERTFRLDRVFSFEEEAPSPAEVFRASAALSHRVVMRPAAANTAARTSPRPAVQAKPCPSASASCSAEQPVPGPAAAPAGTRISLGDVFFFPIKIIGYLICGFFWLYSKIMVFAICGGVILLMPFAAASKFIEITGFGKPQRAAVSYTIPKQVLPLPPAVKTVVKTVKPPETVKPKSSAEPRAVRFAQATGFTSGELCRVYEGADKNRDGKLSWDELRAFQIWMKGTFQYALNSTALRPDAFLAYRKGDCEDWALFTCGILRYWGITSYVGILGCSSAQSGHAVCLFYSGRKPGTGTYYESRGKLGLDGLPVVDGYYIPVDYEKVGSLSNAVLPGFIFEGYYVPEKLYGRTM